MTWLHARALHTSPEYHGSGQTGIKQLHILPQWHISAHFASVALGPFRLKPDTMTSSKRSHTLSVRITLPTMHIAHTHTMHTAPNAHPARSTPPYTSAPCTFFRSKQSTVPKPISEGSQWCTARPYPPCARSGKHTNTHTRARVRQPMRTFRLKQNTVPSPILECTRTVPPCASTSFCTRFRPSPVPPYLRVVLMSTCAYKRQQRAHEARPRSATCVRDTQPFCTRGSGPAWCPRTFVVRGAHESLRAHWGVACAGSSAVITLDAHPAS